MFKLTSQRGAKIWFPIRIPNMYPDPATAKSCINVHLDPLINSCDSFCQLSGFVKKFFPECAYDTIFGAQT